MANLIRIKRSLETSIPSSLANGELAWTSNGDILYIGANDAIEAIGGKRHPGTLTANQALTANSSSLINVVRVGRTGDNTLISNAFLTIANSTASYSLVLPTAAQISSGDYYSASDGTWKQVSGGPGATTIADLTDVTISSVANNNLLVYDNDASQWENHTMAGNSGQVNVSFSSQNITVGLTQSVAIVTSVDVGANVSLTTTRLFVGNSTVNAEANSLGLYVKNATISSSFLPASASLGANVVLSTTDLSIGNSTVNTFANSVILQMRNASSVANLTPTSLAIAANVLLNDVRLHIGNSTVNATMNSISFAIDGDIDCRDATINGNLTVLGTTTTVDTTNLNIEDPLLKLAINNNSADAVDIGLFGLYDTSGSQDLFGGLFRDASDGKWKLFKDLQAEPTTTVNTGGTGYAQATLVAAIESSAATITGGSITGITDLAVADGGTGKSSFVQNGVLYASAATTLTDTGAGSDGTVLQSVSGVPTFAHLDGGTF